ncbi:hypothetical protein [Necropsobacter rosorum]|uniref:hypothetical protein n=1 Tax=Necropsobacter rosorum TaxID=908285 RepID=UPI000509D270
MGLTIKCPLCKGKVNIRTSNRPTPTSVTAELYCTNCGNFKGKFIGEITDIKIAEWKDNNKMKMQTFDENKHKETGGKTGYFKFPPE